MSTSAIRSGPGLSLKLKVGVILASLIVPFVGLIAGLRYLKSDEAELRNVGRVWMLSAFAGAMPYLFILCVSFGGFGDGSG